MNNDILTPAEIVAELDRYIIGQAKAKKAVAIALRNRYRRSRLPQEVMDEITPKNIIMKGPTGVGKTEIARRLAKIVKAPFIKVEATKFTEVGYVGRDVESMIRDLVKESVHFVRQEKIIEVRPKAVKYAEDIIIEAILPMRKKLDSNISDSELKEIIRQELKNSKLDDIIVEVEVQQQPSQTIDLGAQGGGSIDLGDMFGGLMGGKKSVKRKLKVRHALDLLIDQEAEKYIDEEAIRVEGLKRAEQDGIIFIDEIDKICGNGKTSGIDVSREGVQRDILPIVEGSTVSTKYGTIKTDYILFIASGAFHISKVQDLIPELQGRFPVLVELDNLSADDFIKILTIPENAITKQYAQLLEVDNVKIKFTKEAIKEIALIAELHNDTYENIGARRLHAVMETLLEDLLFKAGEKDFTKDVVIDKEYINNHLSKEKEGRNLSKYII